MKIAIVGGPGLLGRQVTAELRKRGHEVRARYRVVPVPRGVLQPIAVTEAARG
jgi:putative NADH-flavin reductase